MRFLTIGAVVLMTGLMASSPVIAKCKDHPGAGVDPSLPAFFSVAPNKAEKDHERRTF